jgi:hypothetical protein
MDMFPKLRAAVSGHVELVKGLNEGKITREEIEQCVSSILLTTPYKDDNELFLKLVENAERDNKTWMDAAQTLSGDDAGWSPWLEKSKPDIEWRYWERYEQLLRHEGKQPIVIERINQVTDETLSQLNSPTTEGPWDRRGMVVGSVQSGKTANYTGLICKAADAGYKVIIVLAGFHKSLRTQTQIRLEEGFLGFYKNEMGRRVPTGVGLIAHDDRTLPNTITTRADDGDFGRDVSANFSSTIDRPLIFVIKKNGSVLQNLIDYLKGQAEAQKGHKAEARISDIPLILIDDESDQGSINTNKSNIKTRDNEETEDPGSEFDPTTINGRIREILNIFEQSAYVAYTATPFANIMIHRDSSSTEFGEDLFPRSFITVIHAPSNYIGPQRMFGSIDEETGIRTRGLPMVRAINDYAESEDLKEENGWMPPRHDKTHIPLFSTAEPVPPSLYEAILSYLLACAARKLRGQDSDHCSMLVHVTRFTDVQNKIAEQLSTVLFQVRQCLVNGANDANFSTWADMEDLWINDFQPTTLEVDDEECPQHTWSEIKAVLPSIVQTVKVREVNGTAGDVLDYEKHRELGLNVIAIGGDKLSRGLTLEGLVVSYFTRPSKTYDTLMQMGRWFGYRDGFLDLTRLYAPQDLINWFRHISDADNELRGDFETMFAIGSTPENFGHRVRTHPLLKITSPVKMRYGSKEKCSYSGDLVQTIIFGTDHDERQKNLNAVEELSRDADTNGNHIPDTPKGKILWKGVDPKAVIRFLESYQSGYQDGIGRMDVGLIAKYIDNQIPKKNLITWTLLISGRASGSPFKVADKESHTILRSDTASSGNQFKPSVITEPRDELYVALDKENWGAALQETKLINEIKSNPKPSDSIMQPGWPQHRKFRSSQEGLLIIYPITPPEEHAVDSVVPFMGFAVSFPGIDMDDDIPVEYVVNPVVQAPDGF